MNIGMIRKYLFSVFQFVMFYTFRLYQIQSICLLELKVETILSDISCIPSAGLEYDYSFHDSFEEF